MSRRNRVAVQILLIAGIHLLLAIGSLWAVSTFVLNLYSPLRQPWTGALEVIYGALFSPLIWILALLSTAGLHWPDAITFILMPINSVLVASLLRAAYVGIRVLMKREGPTKPSNATSEPAEAAGSSAVQG